MKAKEIVNDIKNISGLTIGGGIGITGLLIVRVSSDYEISQLITAGFSLSIVATAGGYLILRNSEFVRSGLTRLGLSFTGWLPKYAEDKPDWGELMAETYHPTRYKFDLPIGVDPDTGQLVEVAMANSESHLLFSGITGTGKSMLVNQAVLGAAMTGNYQVVIVSLSGKDYSLVKNMKNVHLYTMDESDIDDTSELMAAFSRMLLQSVSDTNGEIMARQKLMRRKGLRDLRKYRADYRPPAILLVLEELTNAINMAGYGDTTANRRKSKYMLLDGLKMLINYGRSSMVHVAAVGQRPAGIIPPTMRKQTLNIVTRVADANESNIATGRSKLGAESLRVFDPSTNTPGQALVVGSTTNLTVDIPYSPDDLIEQLAQCHDDAVKNAGPPIWLTAYKDQQKQRRFDEIKLRIPRLNRADPAPEPVDTPTPVTTVTTVTTSPVGGTIEPSTSGKPPVTQVVTPKPVTPTAAQLANLLAAHHPQLQLTDPPTKNQWLALGLFTTIGAPYTVSGPAVFNGSHGSYTEAHQAAEKFVTSLKSNLYLAPLQKSLKSILAFYANGYGLINAPDSLPKLRWVALGLCIHAGMSQNATITAVFGNKNGRYVAFFKQAGEFGQLYKIAQNAAE